MRRRIAAGLVIGFGAVAGCVSARATMLGPKSYSPVPENEVRVFLKESDVPSTCEKYALITTAGAVNSTSEAQMIAAARRRASKVGANGILLTEVKEPGTGARVASALIGIKADRKGQMVAYRCES